MIGCSHILAEHAKGTNLLEKHLAAFAADGVAALSLAKTWRGDYGFVLRDRVVFTGSDRFEFARHAKQEAVDAFTFVVDDDAGPADIVAWRPPHLALWLGRVFALGEEQVLGPRLAQPLRVHESVTSWLAARREGIYVVDHAQAAWALHHESLNVDSPEHARVLRKRLTIEAPPIRVMRNAPVQSLPEVAAA